MKFSAICPLVMAASAFEDGPAFQETDLFNMYNYTISYSNSNRSECT
jgi:hypothetical protein